MRKGLLLVILAGAVASSGVITGAAAAGGVAPAGQANVTPAPDVPAGDVELGSVRIPRSVMANGQPMAAGTYTVRLTAQQSQPDAAGQTPNYERWVEFVQGGEVKGKDVLSIIPGSEIGGVAESSAPGAGRSKVELLKGNDYLRVWINRDSVHYLVHLPVV